MSLVLLPPFCDPSQSGLFLLPNLQPLHRKMCILHIWLGNLETIPQAGDRRSLIVKRKYKNYHISICFNSYCFIREVIVP